MHDESFQPCRQPCDFNALKFHYYFSPLFSQTPLLFSPYASIPAMSLGRPKETYYQRPKGPKELSKTPSRHSTGQVVGSERHRGGYSTSPVPHFASGEKELVALDRREFQSAAYRSRVPVQEHRPQSCRSVSHSSVSQTSRPSSRPASSYTSAAPSLSSQSSRGNRTNLLVFGSTGVGKSSFISLARKGLRGARIGHSLDSCTKDFESFPYVTQGGHQVNLIDTPGFDDSRFSDAEILADLARCLQRLQKQGQQIDGIVFIQPVTDVRLHGSVLKMCEVIKRVCGEDFFDRVALVTSMWNHVEPKQQATADRREMLMLKSPQFWQGFHRRGAQIFRFEHDYRSANDIVEWLVGQSNRAGRYAPIMKMSLELQNDFLLSETSAGSFLLGELSDQRQQHIEAIRDLRLEIRKAEQSGDRASADEFTEEARYEVSCAQQAESARQLLHSRRSVVCQ